MRGAQFMWYPSIIQSDRLPFSVALLGDYLSSGSQCNNLDTDTSRCPPFPLDDPRSMESGREKENTEAINIFTAINSFEAHSLPAANSSTGLSSLTKFFINFLFLLHFWTYENFEMPLALPLWPGHLCFGSCCIWNKFLISNFLFPFFSLQVSFIHHRRIENEDHHLHSGLAPCSSDVASTCVMVFILGFFFYYTIKCILGNLLTKITFPWLLNWVKTLMLGRSTCTKVFCVLKIFLLLFKWNISVI